MPNLWALWAMFFSTSSTRAVGQARVGLPGHREGAREAEPAADPLVQLPHLAGVAAEQLQEAVLGAGGALDPQQAEPLQQVQQVGAADHQVLQPERGPLAQGGGLGRLEVGVAQAAPGSRCRRAKPASAAMTFTRRRCSSSSASRTCSSSLLSVTKQEVAPRWMIGFGQRALLPVGQHPGHHVVAQLPLVALHRREVDVVLVRLQLGDLLLRDLQPQLPLRLGQGHPAAPPEAEAGEVGEQAAHLLARRSGRPAGSRSAVLSGALFAAPAFHARAIVAAAHR